MRREYVCVGNGATELIKCVLEQHTKGRVGITFPTFEEYPNRLPEANIVRFIPDNFDFSYDADNLCTFFSDKKISTLLLVNPDNPSGNYIKKENVLRLAAWCRECGIKLIVDESFVDFTVDHVNNSLLKDEILEANPNLSVMKSISKSYGVPGLRLGIFASSHVEMIAQMKKEVPIWNVNSFAEFYMQIFGKYEKDYFAACEEFIAERMHFFQELKTIDWLRVIPSQANYFLCELVGRYTSVQLCAILLERYDILIKDCATKVAFTGKNYIRIAIRNREDNALLIDAFREIGADTKSE